MDKIWLKSYPAGVPAEIDLNEYTSLNDVLAQSCRKFRDLPAFRNLGATITYAELDRLSRHFAAWLQSLGLAKGTRVALMMPNLLQYPVALFGVLRAGMIVVNINPLYTARELEHQLKDSGAEVIVILENFAHVLETVLANTAVEHVVSTQVGDLLTPHRRLLVNFAVKHMKKMVPEWHIGGAIEFRTALGRGARARLDEAAPSHADIAFLQYTGGTTGRSKGAMLTHGGLVANMLQARAWSRGFLEEGSEIVVTALPMYHVFSLTTNCLLFIKLGGLNLLITNPRDMPGFVKELNTTPWTVMTGVNTVQGVVFNSFTNPGMSLGFVISRFRPPSLMNSRQLVVKEKTWYMGSAVTTISLPSSRKPRDHARACSMFATSPPCVSIAPLDLPVVPPVYCRKAISACDGAASSRRARAPRPSAVRNSMAPPICHSGTIFFICLTAKFTNSRRCGVSRSPTCVDTTCSTAVFASTVSSTCAKFSRMTITSAPESLS